MEGKIREIPHQQSSWTVHPTNSKLSLQRNLNYINAMQIFYYGNKS